MTDTFSFPTTTLIIDKPEIDYKLLQSHYRLIRYVLPYDWSRRGRGLYARLYLQLREQLDVPYIVFQHDTIDSSKKRVIYALYDLENANITQLKFDFLSDTENPLLYTEIQFEQIQLHNLVKLLQSGFSNFYPYFASMGKYYIHVDTEREEWERCIEIKLQGVSENQDEKGNEQPRQEFWVTGHSHYFKQLLNDNEKITDNSKKYKAYYKKSYDKSGFIVFKQLTSNEIATHAGALFYLYSSSANKPHIDYHNQSNSKIEPCRGYSLHQFIQKFTRWLDERGIPCKQKIRHWEKTSLKIMSGGKELDVKQLDTIFLYDARWNTNGNYFSEYQKLLQQMFPEIEWDIINDLSEANNQPILILQDANVTDYKDGQYLDDKTDKYPEIKNKYWETPTQFINVNPNQPKDRADQQSYLTYPVINLQDVTNEDSEELKDTEWGRKFRVAILQLYMKNIVLNKLSPSQHLPISGILNQLTHYGYVRKRSYQDGDTNASIGYRAFLRFEDEHLFFSNLSTSGERKTLEEMCENFGYDWYEIEDILIERRYKQDKEEKEEKDLNSYDLVLMDGLVILINELEETVLYKYDEIKRRLEGRTTKREIEELLIQKHYDSIKPSNATVSLSDLRALGLIGEGARDPDPGAEQFSIEFFNRLDQFDIWLLDHIASVSQKISINELQQHHIDEIIAIFGWDKKKIGIAKSKLLRFYKTIFDLNAATGVDVQLSQGIYFDESDYAYRVGGVNGLNKGSQDRANRIRRFEAIYGDISQFDPMPLLESMSVQFVRYNRYTVHPFPFYLLDIYINDVLRRN